MATTSKGAKARYKLVDGTVVCGVTTLLGVLAKPQLVKWANNLGLKGIDSTTYVDAMARIGTLAHYLIQCDLAGETPDVRDYTANEQDAAAQSIASWMAWRRVHSITPILQETPLVSETYKYGGTIDLYAEIDGVKTLADIKTAKAIYSEHITQVVAYEQLLQEHGHIVGNSRIIRVGREPGEGFEERNIEYPLDHWQLFLHCLAIYNLQKVLK